MHQDALVLFIHAAVEASRLLLYRQPSMVPSTILSTELSLKIRASNGSGHRGGIHIASDMKSAHLEGRLTLVSDTPYHPINDAVNNWKQTILSTMRKDM